MQNSKNTSVNENLILMTDSYKASHFLQYPPGTSRLMGYLESRGGRYGQTVFFGLQYILKRYLDSRVMTGDVDEAQEFFSKHGEPFPRAGWDRIVHVHNGKMPLRIRAVPEGTVVPTQNVLMTVESTDSEIPWITTWVETLLMRIWYPISVATLSWHCKKTILRYLNLSADNPLEEIGFKLHDFGARGVSSSESAGIGGMAHLVNFLGSDTIEGVRFANHYYRHDMAAFSVPAAEHSTITAWGPDREAEAYANMVKQFGGPGKIFACVSDSYNLYRAVERIWCDDLREMIEKSGSTLVIRPDSGDPPSVCTETLRILDRKLPMTVNAKGFKVLPPYFRIIQGDGNDDELAIDRVLKAITDSGYSATNISFGMGGGLLQKIDRDTQRFAFKICEATINGKNVPISKSPVTDPGKRSKGGNLDLVVIDGEFKTVVRGHRNDSVLRTVFDNKEILVDETLDIIRTRVNTGHAKLKKY